MCTRATGRTDGSFEAGVALISPISSGTGKCGRRLCRQPSLALLRALEAMTVDSPACLVCFVLIALYEQCTSVSCAIGFWAERASSLAGVVASGSKSEHTGAVTIYTKCWAPRDELTTYNRASVRLRVLPDVPADLRKAPAFVPETTPSFKFLAISVLKWVAVGLDECEFVVLSDLDVVLLRPNVVRMSDVATEWIAAFDHMRSTGLRLLSQGDTGSPMNAGFILIRPSKKIYLEGIELLLRANSSFNSTHGWDLRGRPRDVLPATDGVWTGTNSYGSKFLARNDWAYYGAPIDQGLLFYIFRVAHPLGADLPLRYPPGAGQHKAPVYRMIHMFNKPFRAGRPPSNASCARPLAWKRGLKPSTLFNDLTQNSQRKVKQMAFMQAALAAFALPHSSATVPAEVRSWCNAFWADHVRCLRQAFSTDGLALRGNTSVLAASEMTRKEALLTLLGQTELSRWYPGGTSLWTSRSRHGSYHDTD